MKLGLLVLKHKSVCLWITSKFRPINSIIKMKRFPKSVVSIRLELDLLDGSTVGNEVDPRQDSPPPSPHCRPTQSKKKSLEGFNGKRG